jgi:hypothetical protein
MKTRAFFALILFSLGAAFAAPLRADDRVIPPAVAKVWPAGMQRGTTATFTLEGRNLSDIKAVIFDSPGISAKVTQVTDMEEEKPMGFTTVAPVPRAKKQTATLEVTAAQDVAPGLHWFRVRTPLGTSNLMPFDVGSLPEVYAHGKSMGRAEMPPEPARCPPRLSARLLSPAKSTTSSLTAGWEKIWFSRCGHRNWVQGSNRC